MSGLTEFMVDYWQFIAPVIPLGWLIKRNMAYSTIIEEFKLQLPRRSKRARKMTEEELKRNPQLGQLAQVINVMNTKGHEAIVTEGQINTFFNQLDTFNYTGVIFHKRYKVITRNLKRFEGVKAVNKNFDLVMIQELLDRVKVGFWELLWETMTLRIGAVRFHIKQWRCDLEERRAHRNRRPVKRS